MINVKPNSIAIYHVIILCLVITLSSCVRDSEVPEDYDAKLGINAAFAPDSTWSVYIFQTRSIFDPSNDFDVTDAVVILEDKTNGIEFTLEHSGNGMYTAGARKPYIGHEYLISVYAEGFPDVYAEAYVPSNIDVVLNHNYGDGEILESVRFDIIDNTEEENFYILELRKIEKEEPNVSINTPVSSVEGGTPKKNFSDFLEESDFGDGGKYTQTWTKEDLGGLTGDTSEDPAADDYELKVMSVSRDLYLYLKSNNIHDFTHFVNSSNTTSFGLHSNVINGKGVFGSYNQQLIKL